MRSLSTGPLVVTLAPPMRTKRVHRAAVFGSLSRSRMCASDPTDPWVAAIGAIGALIRVDQDGDSVGWAQDGAESNAAFRSPPAAVAASWAVVSNVAADDFAALAAWTV